MKILTVDAVQDFYSIAILIKGRILYREFFDRNTISKNLVLDIKSILEDADTTLNELDYLLTNPGPGSFTGIRASISALQAFELIYNKPLYGLNMFEAIAIYNRDQICKHKEVKVIMKSDNYNSYIQSFNSKIEAISPINRVKNDTITTNMDKEKITIFTNNDRIFHDHLVQANAQIMTESFLYKLSQDTELSLAVPTYIY